MPRTKGIYAITDCENLSDKTLLLKSEKILDAGISLFQYRNKNNNIELALALQFLCRKYQTPFIVNDDLALAKEIEADGVHLGRDDENIEIARTELGGKIIGVSCYNDIKRAIYAEKAGASYVAFGSFFPSKTKPDTIRAKLKVILKAKLILTKPVVAIGGITTENGKELVDANVDYLAVISGLFAAADSVKTVKAYKFLFK